MRIEYDPRLRSVRADPFPIFRRMQDEDPVHKSDILRGWVLTRYADVKAAFLDRSLSSDRITPFFERMPEERRNQLAQLKEMVGRWAVFRDPPVHTQQRSQTSKTFTPQAAEAWRPRIRQIVDGLLDQVVERQTMDVIRDFAYPLPATVIMEMIGVPLSEIQSVKAWSDDLALFIGSALAAPDKYDRAQAATQGLISYFRALAREKRIRPRDDLLSRMVAQEGREGGLTEDELVTDCIALLFAGHETTTNLISNGLLALLSHPAELQRLRRQPALIGSAVEELLRFASPIGAQVRIATEDFALHGAHVESGSRLFLMVHAANRDPRQFGDPDRLDIAREDNPHLTFGSGIHYCLGASLARAEGQIALSTLLRRLHEIELQPGALEWIDSLVLRGVKSLPISFRVAGR